MMNECTVMIAGEAGQGVQTTGFILCKLFKAAGYNIFANQDYMSRIRGGNNYYQVRVSCQPVYAPRRFADIIVALDSASVEIHRPNLAPRGIMLFDNDKLKLANPLPPLYPTPFHNLASNQGGGSLYINMAACGAVTALTGLPLELVERMVMAEFTASPVIPGTKGNDVINRNLAAVKAGYEFISGKIPEISFNMEPACESAEALMNGSDAIALGAIAAGCKFYSAYPMSPATGILNVIARHADDYAMVVEQAEDEIAAINMVIGASFAGARAMTATSGGGFALMGEGISLAGMTETPVVVVNAQRPAPATGFPTRTEQADLDFVLNAGHGEFAKAVYTPGSLEEAFYLTKKAFVTAEKHQIPAIILTDQHLADSYRNLAWFINQVPNQRYHLSKEESREITGYRRYQLTDSGISPLAVPSWIDGVVCADSDEHNETGHIVEDAATRTSMVDKRLHRKMPALAAEVQEPVAESIAGARIVLIGFGSTYGLLKEIIRFSGDLKLGYIHLPQVWPFPVQTMQTLLAGDATVLTVENNATGQLAKLLRRETGFAVSGSILKYDGRPFTLEYLDERLRHEVTR